MGRELAGGDPPPYMVQAHRPGKFTTWFTDSSHRLLDVAIASAQALEGEPWFRKVRVIDQNEHVHYRSPGAARRGFQKGHGGFARKDARKAPRPGGYGPRAKK